MRFVPSQRGALRKPEAVRERSKAMFGLGLDEDYHSLDRHEEEGTPGQRLCKAQGRKSVCHGRTSEEATREARYSWYRPLSAPTRSVLTVRAMGRRER